MPWLTLRRRIKQSMQQRIEDWKQRSKALLDQIYAVDPYYVSSNECRFIGQASYADITAGRTSPSSRNCSPYRHRDVTPSTTATQVLQPAFIRVQKSTVECLPLNEAQVSKVQIQESDLDKPKTQTKLQAQCVQTMENQATIEVEENQQDIPEVLVESPVTHRGRSPTRKINSSTKSPKAIVILEEELDRYDNRRLNVTPRQEKRAESTRNTLKLHEEQKGRSPSPMWIPGSTSYADILRGCIQTQINIAFAEPSRQEMVSLSGESSGDRTLSPCTEQVAESFTMNVDESPQITETSQVVSVQDTQIEDIEIAETYSPETSVAKIEEQSYAESGPSNWTDKHLEDMLPYENLPRQSVTETVQSTEIYDYMVPEPMPKLIGFIGSQLGTYPVSSYVYATSGHQQVQQLDTANLNPYNNSSLTYAPEHYVVPTAYLSTSDIYQQTQMQQQCPVNDTRHEIPMLIENPVEVPIVRQEVPKDEIITESINKSKQKELVNVSETSVITKTEGRDTLLLNETETKGQIFSYAQILSQGLSPRITSSTHANKQDVINKSPTVDQQNKEQSSLSFRELSPLQESKQDSDLIPKLKQFNQSKKNDWDTIKKREIKKRQSNDKTEQTDEKKSRKLVDKSIEKQNKEKLSPPKQLEIQNESNVINDSSEEKKREEKPMQQEKQIDSKDMNMSQEKKRKQKKKKVDKSVGDEIDKALKEIEDMDKQKVKSQREKLKEQIDEQNKSQKSADETLRKSKDEADKKQIKLGETSIKSGKSKKMTKVKENVLLGQATLQNQMNVKDLCILKDNVENKEDIKNAKILNSDNEEKVQKDISNNILKDQSQIDKNVHIKSDKPDIKTKHKNKTNKNNTKGKEQREKSSDNKIQKQSDFLNDKTDDKISIINESSITEITELSVASKLELKNEKSNAVEIENTKKQKDASKKEKNKTKSKKLKLNAEINNKNQEKLENDTKEIIDDKHLKSIKPMIDTEMKNSESKTLDTAEIANKVNNNAKDKTNPKKKDKTSKSKMKSEVAIDHTLSVTPTSKILDETEIKLNETEIEKSSEEIDIPKQITEAKIAERAVIANLTKIQSKEIELASDTVSQTQDIEQTDIKMCKNDIHEAKELKTENEKLEHNQTNTKLEAENLMRESSETSADMTDEKKTINSDIKIEKTKKHEAEKRQIKTGKQKKSQKAKSNVQDKNKIRKDNIETPQLVESENKSVGEKDKLNTESLSKPPNISTIENIIQDQYIEKPNENESVLVPDSNSCLVQSKTDTENNLDIKIDERENAILGQVNKHVPSLSKNKKKDKKSKTVIQSTTLAHDIKSAETSESKDVIQIAVVKSDISTKEDNESMENIKDADKLEAASILTKVTPKKEINCTASENLTKISAIEIMPAIETIPVISESSPEMNNMNVKEKDQIVDEERFDHHKQQPIIEDNKDNKTNVIEDFPIKDEKSEDVTSKKIRSKCTKRKEASFPKHITEQTKHPSSFYDKFQEKIVFDNLIKEKEISELASPEQKLGKNPSSPTKINNIEIEETQETKKQSLKNAEAKIEPEILSDSVAEAKIHENLESEQLPPIGKALIIEKTITTVTTTSTSIPGSIKIKPADVKSVKSVEILENIPLPKIVGSKVTELITLRPETVEASLITTYARVGNNFPVSSCPTQSNRATNSERIGFISANSTENKMASDESAPFESTRGRREICPGILKQFDDAPTIIALEDKERELVAHSDGNTGGQEQTILLNESTIEQEDIRQSDIKVSERERETDDTKKEETLSVAIISHSDNIIRNEDINNYVETDNVTEINKIDQVVSCISKKEELEENKANVHKITQNDQEEALDEQIETKCENNLTINEIKSEKISENMKTKKQIIPDYLLDVIKPYVMDRHAYNQAESNFYRNFKVVKVVKELQPPAAVIQTKPENIEIIVQESVMKPKSTNQEMSEINRRRHALIIETPKYPISSFYEIESQWIKNKSISEKSISVSTDNSDSRNSAVEKIDQTIEEKMSAEKIQQEEQQDITLVNSIANIISLTNITEDLNSASSDSISQAISKSTELNASVASPIEKITNDQLADAEVTTDTNIQMEEAVAKNNIKTEQELLESKTAPVMSSIHLESDDAWMALLEEEIILDDNFDVSETRIDDQIEKEEEKIEREAKIEKLEKEEVEKKEIIIEKQEEKDEKRETTIEEREENFEKEKAKIKTSDNVTLMEIAVKDEYHTGIKDIQSDILYIDSKKQSDKMKNQPKKKKESKHIKDTKTKDNTKIKAGSKKQSDVEIKTNATESLLLTQSNVEQRRTLGKIPEPDTDKIEKSLIANEEQSESSKDATLKQKEQDVIDEAYEKPSSKFEEHKSKSKKSKKQIDKSAITENLATSKHQDNTKEDHNNVSPVTTEIKSNVLGASSIVQNQEESTGNKYDNSLNSNAKSWAAIVGTKDVTESMILEDDSLNTQTCPIICQDTINNVKNIVEIAEIPLKQNILSSTLETSKDVIEDINKTTTTDEIVKPIAEKSIESKKQLKEGNKSYAQVAASSRRTFPQSSQEKIYAILNTRIIEPIPLKPEPKVSNAKIFDEMHENLNTDKLLEQDKQIDKITVHQSADQKTDTAKSSFQNESISWIEEIEEETSTLSSICTNSTSSKDDETKPETNTWAAIVSKKSIESPEVDNVPSPEQNLKQIAGQRPSAQVQIYVEKSLEQEPIENLIQVDEQGFMEFINRKELRSRRSRSRSRSVRRNDGHAIAETSDGDKKVKTSNIGSENKTKKIEDKNKEPAQRYENEQKIIDVQHDELAKIIKKDLVEELPKPSEKLNASKNKNAVKQQKDSNKGKKEGEKQLAESKIQNAKSKVIQEIKPEQDKTFEDRKSKPEKNKDQIKQHIQVDKQKEVTHIEKPQEEQKFVNEMEISNQSQLKNIENQDIKIENQDIKNIEDQSIKQTQLIEDINVQENKSKNGKESLVTGQSNTTKSKKKSKNKKAKVTEQLTFAYIGNVSDISKKEVLIGELEEKREIVAEPKLDDEVKMKLDEATAIDITHNKSTNEDIPAEKNKQEDKQQTTDETTEQKSFEQNVIDELKNTKIEKSDVKQIDEDRKEQKEISKLTKTEKRKQKKKIKALVSSEESKKKGFEMEENVVQNKFIDNTNIIEDTKVEKTVEMTEEVTNIAPLKDKIDVASVKENDESITAQIETTEKSLEKSEVVIENKTLLSQINPTKDKDKHKSKTKAKKEKRKIKSQETFTADSKESETLSTAKSTEITNISKDISDTQIKEDVKNKKLDNESTENLQLSKDTFDENNSSVTLEIIKEENIKNFELLAFSTEKEIVEIPLSSEKRDEQKSLKKHDVKIEDEQESKKHENLLKCSKEDITDIIDKNVLTPSKLIDITTKETDLKTEFSFDYSKEKEKSVLTETKFEENIETSNKETKEEELTIDSEKMKTITETEQIIEQKGKLFEPEEAASSNYDITLTMIDTKQQTELPEIEKPYPKPDDTLELFDITIVNNDQIKKKSITDNIETDKSDEIELDRSNLINIHTPTELSSDLINIDASPDELSSAEQHFFADGNRLKRVIEQENFDVSIEPVKPPKVQFYIADEILVLNSDRRRNVPSTSNPQEQSITIQSKSHNLSIDHGFWLDKQSYHEAERDHFENLAVRAKKRLSRDNERNSDDRNRPRDHDDDDRDGDNSGGRSQHSHGDSRLFLGGPQTERMIADLPGGICSWRDYSTYLSNESERTPDHSLSLGAMDSQTVGSDSLLDYSKLRNDDVRLFPDHRSTSPSFQDPTKSLIDLAAEVNPEYPALSSSNSSQSSDPGTRIQSSTLAHLRPRSKLHLGKETWQDPVRRCNSDEEAERETIAEDKIEKRICRIQVRSPLWPVFGLLVEFESSSIVHMCIYMYMYIYSLLSIVYY